MNIIALLMGMIVGSAISIITSFSSLLNNSALLFILPFTTFLGVEFSLGYILGLKACSGIFKYLYTLDTKVHNQVDIIKQITTYAESYFNIRAIVSLICIGLTFILPIGKIIPFIGVLLPISVIVVGFGWVCYILLQSNYPKYIYLLSIVVLGGVAVLVMNSGIKNETAILFASLYSVSSLSLNKTKYNSPIGKGNNEPESDRNSEIEDGSDNTNSIIMPITSAILSSVFVGFPNVAGNLDNINNTNNEIREAVANAVSDIVGIFLFCLQGVGRDSTTSVLSTLFITAPINFSLFPSLIILSLLCSYVALQLLPIIVKGFFQWEKNVMSNKSGRGLVLGLMVVGLGVTSGSIVISMCLVGVGYFLSGMDLDPTFNSSLTVLLPCAALFGII